MVVGKFDAGDEAISASPIMTMKMLVMMLIVTNLSLPKALLFKLVPPQPLGITR